MIVRLVIAALLTLAGAACAAPPSPNRAVDHGPLWLVRLDSQHEPGLAPRAAFSHPMDISDAELTMILEHVFIADADPDAPTRPLFSYGALTCIVPGLREALHRATPAEWLVFSVIEPKATHQTYTSGGLYMRDRRLHLVVTNHRLKVPAGRHAVVDPATAAPLEIHDPSAQVERLVFEPPQFMGRTEGENILPPSADRARRVVINYDALVAARAQWSALLPPVRGETAAAHMMTGC